MKRTLSDTFINDLRTGLLKGLLEYVKNDNTLDLEIREGYINIYYRGGNALRVTEKGVNNYDYHFDNNYMNTNYFNSKKTFVVAKPDTDWYIYFPRVKQAMDFYFTEHNKEEREYQQLVVRENNYSSIANSTDYFILDIEYDNHKNARFDLVAIEWLSTSSSRGLLRDYKPKLVIIEMKYGDGALTGSAGINKHISDFNNFVANAQTFNDFKDEMLGVFNQKLRLGLIPCLLRDSNPYLSLEDKKHEKPQFDDEIEMMFLIANHDPAKSVLGTEVSSLKNMELKFLSSNFMGYGLFKENTFDTQQFTERFKTQI